MPITGSAGVPPAKLSNSNTMLIFFYAGGTPALPVTTHMNHLIFVSSVRDAMTIITPGVLAFRF
jgi:hypothetical protein